MRGELAVLQDDTPVFVVPKSARNDPARLVRNVTRIDPSLHRPACAGRPRPEADISRIAVKNKGRARHARGELNIAANLALMLVEFVEGIGFTTPPA